MTIAADDIERSCRCHAGRGCCTVHQPRVNTIASIMTFTNNAQTMTDLSSAIYGTAALLIASGAEHHCHFTNVNEQ